MGKERSVPKLRFPGFEGEWERKRLGDVADINRGVSKHRPRDEASLYGGPYPFIQTGDIRRADTYILSHSQTYSEAGLKQSKLWKEETLCITIAANIAETAILKYKACFPDSVIGILPNPDVYNTYFLKLQIDRYRNDIQKLSQGLAQSNLNKESLGNLEFNLAALPEQTKIADFLSTVDARIQALKQKHVLLERYKQGMMQRLFSQALRFRDEDGKDFPDWEEKRLGEVAPFQRGFDLPVDRITNGKYPVVFSNGILKFHNEFKVKGPGVVTGRSGTIGNVTFVEDDFWPHNTSLWVTDFMGNYPKYIYYLYSQFRLEQFGGGSGVPTLNRNDVHMQSVSIPSIPEQTKIADFLSGIDRKIGGVKALVGKMEQWKKGLLQQLFV